MHGNFIMLLIALVMVGWMMDRDAK